jgi:hypothetical protein
MARWWYRKPRPKIWILWRERARQRDNYNCVLCGKRKKIMDPHHILPKAIFPKLKYNVNNCATLCRKCHKTTFKKEVEFVEILVNKLFGGLAKWNLTEFYQTLKRLKCKSPKVTRAKRPRLVKAVLLPSKLREEEPLLSRIARATTPPQIKERKWNLTE